MTTPIPAPPWTIGTTLPLALLPVRVETRFTGAENEQLRIRIFPDTLHVDSHEPPLTAEEAAAARRYWEDAWRAAGEQARRTEAWLGLVALFGPGRARWIAQVMEPDPAGRPAEPIPPGAPLPTAPAFPSPRLRAASWTRAAVARLLPARWCAVAVTGEQRAAATSERPVRPDLVVGLDPDADLSAVLDDAAPVDTATRWMTDYQAAVDAGMALTLDLPPALREGIDRLLVFGVSQPPSPTAGSDALAHLLEAHAATDGLAHLPPGTPTNNTDGARSGLDPAEPGPPVWHTDTVPDRTTEAGRLARALGLPLSHDPGGHLASARTTPPRPGAPTAPARLLPAGPADTEAARTVQAATWSATWGYFLRHMMAGAATPADVERVRAHYLDWVRAEGPLPTLRIGNQPYGVLPVMETGTWEPLPGESDDRTGIALLARLRSSVWKPSVDRVPRLGRPARPEENLVGILGSGPRALEVRARSLLGEEYVIWLWRFLRLRLGKDWRSHLFTEPMAVLRTLELAGEPPLGRAVFASGSYPLRTPLAAPGTGPGTPDGYLTALAARGLLPAALLHEDRAVPRPLLHRLARAALLDEFSRAAAQLGAAEPTESQLIDIAEGETTPTLERRLAGPRPAGASTTGQGGLPPASSATTLGEYLALALPTDPGGARLAEQRAALAAAAALTPEQASRHLAGVLGLASHRLDAWITSFATKRLETLRTAAPTGLHTGAYGWALDLRPAVRRAPVTTRPPWESGPLTHGGPATGYVLAPSVGQATTAAVLRSAQRSHGGEAFAVDLSSRRVRLAGALLDGVRAGRPIGVLLGALAERALHEHPRGTMDRYLPTLRALAPAETTVVAPDGTVSSGGAAGVLTDGLALHLAHRDGRLPWGGPAPAPRPGAPAPLPLPAGGEDRAALEQVLSVLTDAVDAVHDSLLAEGVHQVVQGRPERAAAAVDLLARGEAPPAELEFARSPRSGDAVTHRLLLAGNQTPVGRADWPAATGHQPRILAAAAADAVAASLLPTPARVRCVLHWEPQDGGSGQPLPPTVVNDLTFDRLQISAIDHVMARRKGLAVDDTAELERRIAVAAWAAARPAASAGHPYRLRLDFGRLPSWPAGAVSVTEFLTAVGNARELLLRARPLTATDLVPPGEEPAADEQSAATAAQDTQNRADFALEHLRSTLAQLGGETAPEITEATLPALRTALVRAAGAGIAAAVPPPAGRPGEKEAVTQCTATARAELLRRLAAHDALVSAHAAEHPAGAPATARERTEHHRDRLHELLDADLPVLPPLLAPAGTGLADSLASAPLQGRPGTAHRWLRQYGRVRGGAARWQDAVDFADMLGAPLADAPRERLRVAQLPHRPGDVWWGAESTTRPADSGRLSLVVGITTPGPLDLSRQIHGLALDEWTETVPATRNTAALAVEYDAPAAAPPQTVLLAVPPNRQEAAWSPAALERLLHQTLDLARIRAVDLDLLEAVGQFLPAVYLGLNTDGLAVSTDPAVDAAPPTG
ncbi:hypothetical protein KNE206_41800 [Kitasatospora sp. NE20-6]|uniref:hypothetical protein n=1 Tax=Kitasatospora sp. NE20-6 TaxID=2859066 RepID=UPI0034DC2137